MTDSGKREPLTLRRWSQRKLAAAHEAQSKAAQPPEPTGTVAPPPSPDTPAPQAVAGDPPRELPPVDSLSIDSDFTAFMRPDVDESLKRGALRKLFSDPRFNVMDGLDVYIDDYSKPDPIAPEVVRQLMQARYIFDPPATRVTASGHVEDVPPDEAAAMVAAQDAPSGELPAAVEAETLAANQARGRAPEPAAAAQPADAPAARDVDSPSR